MDDTKRRNKDDCAEERKQIAELKTELKIVKKEKKEKLTDEGYIIAIATIIVTIVSFLFGNYLYQNLGGWGLLIIAVLFILFIRGIVLQSLRNRKK